MSAVAAPRLALSGHDLYLFREGTHSRLYQKLGAHLVEGAIEFALGGAKAPSPPVVGAKRGGGGGGRRLQRLGPAPAPDAADRRGLGHLVCASAASAPGKPLQV